MRNVRELGGVFVIQQFIFSPSCRLGKNARLVTLAIAAHMRSAFEATAGIDRLVAVTGLGRSAVVEALKVACGEDGALVKHNRGQGRCNRFTIRPEVRLPSF